MSADTHDLLAASRRERALYEALVETYRELDGLLAGLGTAAGVARVQRLRERSEALTAGLRSVHEWLAPARLAGADVGAAIRDCWRASAELAGAAATACRQLTERARARQAETAERLRALAAGRRGLAGYRPAAERRGAVAEQHA